MARSKTTDALTEGLQAGAAPENAVHADNRTQWRAWLEQHHPQKDGVWLVLWKKASGRAELTYNDAVEEALCFGWIDSKPNSLDAHRSLLWFAPRKPATGWSRVNKARIERLLALGHMAPAGIAKVETAKADGSWNALDAIESLEVPDDLGQALSQWPLAAGYFEAFPRSVKRSILEWISLAKTPPTRAKRIAETARLAAINERANQWRK